MLKQWSYIMFVVGMTSIFAAAFINNSATSTTGNVIASNAKAFSYVEALLFSIAAASLIMGTAFLKHSKTR